MTMFARVGFVIAFAAAAAASFSPARAAPTIDKLVDDAFCKGTSQRRAEYIEKHPDFRAVKCGQASPKPSVTAAKPVQPDPTADAKPKPKPLPASGTVTFVPTYFVRNAWSDLGPLGAGCFSPTVGVPVAKASGAAVSFTRDYANNNKIWVTQGMVGAVYSKCTELRAAPNGDHGFMEQSIAAYAQINSDYNSNATFAKKNNADTRTVGLSGEVAYLHSWGDIDIIRITPNVVFDNINNTTATAVMVQYIPFWLLKYLWTEEGFPGASNLVNVQFDPTFDIQYANAMEHSKPLQFSGKDQSLRLGPELTFIFTPVGSKNNDNFWANLGLSETFHPWYEAYDGRGSYWWDNSIFYNITKNFAVKLSYQRGLDENSGNMTNKYIASLTGKY